MRIVALFSSLLVLISFGGISCTTTTTQSPPPGTANYATEPACSEGEEVCLLSKQEGAGVRCLPISQCGEGTIEEGGKCEQSSQCNNDSLKCCTKGPMQAAEHLRCHQAEQCSPGTIQ